MFTNIEFPPLLVKIKRSPEYDVWCYIEVRGEGRVTLSGNYSKLASTFTFTVFDCQKLSIALI